MQVVEREHSHRVRAEDLQDLPPVVKRYLTYTGIIGRSWIKTVRVQYSGSFRMAADKAWMPISVNQVYTTDPPAFLWKATFKMAGVPFMFAVDTFKGGHGHMQGKVLGMFTVVDGSGPQIDQGTMVRYLQEMTWFPTAFLGKNVTWQEVDNHAADVTLHAYGTDVTGRLYFDDAGRLLNFVAQRYGDFNGTTRMETWSAPTTDYGVFAGLNLPASGVGVWQLPAGDLAYVNVRVGQIEYNQPIDSF
ncbi:MAG: DUF6544 family protein [Anaerolineae bacterium]